MDSDLGVVLRLHGNGLVFEDAERGVRVKASCAGPVAPTVSESLWKDYAQSLNNARLERQHAWSSYRDSASRERRRLKEKYRHQRGPLRSSQTS